MTVPTRALSPCSLLRFPGALAMLSVLLCGSCAEPIEVVAARYSSGSLGSVTKLPVCFAKAADSLGPAARSQHDEMASLCAYAARREGVATASSGECLVAKMTWKAEKTGAVSSCGGGVGGVTCSGQAVFRQSLKLSFVDESTGMVVIESLASTTGTGSNPTKPSLYSLCSAGFRGYPQPAKQALYEIEIPH